MNCQLVTRFDCGDDVYKRLGTVKRIILTPTENTGSHKVSYEVRSDGGLTGEYEEEELVRGNPIGDCVFAIMNRNHTVKSIYKPFTYANMHAIKTVGEHVNEYRLRP